MACKIVNQTHIITERIADLKSFGCEFGPETVKNVDSRYLKKFT